MEENEKIKELQEQIAKKKAELAEVEKKQKVAISSPDKLVELNRTAAGIKSMIDALEHTYSVASYQQPERTDMELLLSGVYRYVDEKTKKVQKVQKSIDDANAELGSVEQLLQSATEEGNADEVIQLSKQRDDLKEKMKYLYQMKDRTTALRTFPEGALYDEWEKICAEKKEDFDCMVQRVVVLAAAYKSACAELIEMKELLLGARRKINRIGIENGESKHEFPSILTVGVKVEDMVIKKSEGNKPFEVISGDVFSTAL